MPNILGISDGVVRPIGFDRAPEGAGRDLGAAHGSETGHILNDHFYCCQVDLGMCNGHSEGSGEPKSDKRSGEICDSFHRRRIWQRDRDAQKL